ncbi:hypothetical protein J3R83DRAFT_12009 [Lanmaoa asiatica]|nr:hypothetical protein J3R83DRAFT_12009 [Lanmaoa asiatica]
MPVSLFPLALIVPRPNIPASVPLTYAPRTPNRSPVAPHILLSPPSANRNSTDSWNSSNYDFEDPNAVWKEDQVRLLSRVSLSLAMCFTPVYIPFETLDALPAHLITPFNGSVPPSNLLDKIARGISAAKGPNDWPHSIRATRIKLLELARRKAQEERRKAITEEAIAPLSEVARQGDIRRAKTPDPVEVLQLRTNTPIHVRRPLYRQSSMDFMNPDQPDRSESIARLSTRLQRHDRVLHHPYLRPVDTRHRSEYNRPFPSTPSSSTLDSNRYPAVRKSTISVSSTSSSSFGSPMSISAPLRPSSLRRASTLTLASTSEVHVDADADAESALKNDFRRSGGHPEASMGTKVAVGVKPVPSYIGGSNAAPPAPATPAGKPKKPKLTPVIAVASQRKTVPNSSAGEMKPMPRTPPNEPCVIISEKATPIQTSTHTKKVRKGHKPQFSFSSDEEEKMRSKTAKKVRTREPSWSIPLASSAQVQPSLLLSSALPRGKEGSDSGRSTSTGIRSKTSMSSSSSTDNDLSTASTETAATTVSISSTSTSQAKHKSPRNINLHIQAPPFTQSPVEAKKPARRNPARNPSMFGHELPCPQRTPASPSRIPVSSPMPLSPPVNSAANASSASPLSSRPRTLRRAARRISFGSATANGSLLSPVGNPRGHGGETPALGSAFQLA